MATTTARRVQVPDTDRADCSCCGAEPTPTRPTFRAGLVDSDDTYYPRLCGTCFDMIEAEPAKIRLAHQLGDYTSHDFGAQKRAIAGELVAAFPSELEDAIPSYLGDVA